MKKTLALLLTLGLALGALAACNTANNNGDNNGTENQQTQNADTSAYTLQGIVDSIYAQKAPLFMYGTMPVDLSDEYSYKTYLGLDDPSVIKEAVFSESMMGAQAYSLVIARVAEGQDAAKIAESMKAGIDTRKWICVEADDVKTATYGDLVCFIMISSEYKDFITAEDVTTAFESIMNGTAKYEEGAQPNIPEMPEDEEAADDEIIEDEILVDEDVVMPEVSELEAIINDIYAVKAPQFMLGSIPVDLSDEFSYKTYLGLDDPSVIEQAIASESMIGAQAYSLVVAKVVEGQNAEEIAEKMKAGIDTRKWICVEADDVKVKTIGNYICFCMIDSEFAPDFTAQDAIDGFTKALEA